MIKKLYVVLLLSCIGFVQTYAYELTQQDKTIIDAFDTVIEKNIQKNPASKNSIIQLLKNVYYQVAETNIRVKFILKSVVHLLDSSFEVMTGGIINDQTDVNVSNGLQGSGSNHTINVSTDLTILPFCNSHISYQKTFSGIRIFSGQQVVLYHTGAKDISFIKDDTSCFFFMFEFDDLTKDLTTTVYDKNFIFQRQDNRTIYSMEKPSGAIQDLYLVESRIDAQQNLGSPIVKGLINASGKFILNIGSYSSIQNNGDNTFIIQNHFGQQYTIPSSTLP